MVTAYLDLAAEQPDAAARLETGWKDLLRELVDEEVDRPTIEAVAAAQPDPPLRGATLVIVAAGGKVHLSRRLPSPPIAPSITVASLPHLLPLISWQASRRAYVVVLADRAGAEITAYRDPAAGPVTTVTEETAEWPIHKTGRGGWATKRFDATVEENWARSAKRVVALVEEAARVVEPAVVVASGDERALALLRDDLPERLRTDLVVVPGGGRHADGSDDVIERRVETAVAERVARDEQVVLDHYNQALGRHEGAASGLSEVVAALQQGLVGTLVMRTPDLPGRTLYYGPQSADVAIERDELSALGISDISEGAACDVILRAAAHSGAQVLTLADGRDAPVADGVGAILRAGLG